MIENNGTNNQNQLYLGIGEVRQPFAEMSFTLELQTLG
jgi:hypothetical protein